MGSIPIFGTLWTRSEIGYRASLSRRRLPVRVRSGPQNQKEGFFLLFVLNKLIVYNKLYMSTYLFTMLIVFFVIIILAIITFKKMNQEKKEIDYFILFVLGIIWLPAGISAENYILSLMGLIFILTGILNKNKWKKPEDNWKNLTLNQKRFKIIIISLLGLLFLTGLIVWYVFSS